MTKTAAVVFSVVVAIMIAASSACGAVPADSCRAGTLFIRAMRDFNATDYRTALNAFERIDDAENPPVLSYYKGVCLYQTGDYAGAIDCLSKLTNNDTLYSLASYYLAETMLALHKQAAALVSFRNCLEEDSTYVPARLEYIRTLCALGSFKIAEEFVKRKEDGDGVLTLAQGLVKAGKFKDAYPYLAFVVSRDSTNSLAQLLLGETYFKTERYAYAERVYSRLDSAFGPSPFVVRRLALCCGNMPGRDNLEKAISTMTRYLVISRDTTGENLGDIGMWYYNLSLYDSAEIYFRSAASRDTLDAQPRLNLGLALLKLEKYDDAVKQMGIAYKLSKSSMSFSLTILKGLAAAELRLKEYLPAIRDYDLILKINPDDAEAVYGLGLAYDQSGRTANALHWYRKFVSMKNQSGLNADFSEYARSRIDSLSVKKMTDCRPRPREKLTYPR